MIELDLRAGIATVTLDRAPVNALDAAMVDRLASVVAELERLRHVKVAVFRSARRVFCAGADITTLSEFLAEPDGPARLAAYAGRLQSVLARLAALPIFTIAEVNGAATGGGLELALACDVRLAADTARVGLTEANIGLVPGAGGTQRLTAVAGRSRALLTLLSGQLLSAADALRAGVVDEVHGPDELIARTSELTEIVARHSREVVVELKRCVLGAGTSRGFHIELDATERLAALPGTQELMKKFLNRDKAVR